MQQRPRLLVLDNHDSFTYNLLEACRSHGQYMLKVKTPEEWSDNPDFRFEKVIISPGPGLPEESKGLFQAIDLLWSKTPILGVCLGLQAIVEYRGGKIERSEQPYHGLDSQLKIIAESDPIFRDLKQNCRVGRYHSWRVNRQTLPDEFKITSEDSNGTIMSISHKMLPIFGVQFHPESYISEQGEMLIYNFLKL